MAHAVNRVLFGEWGGDGLPAMPVPGVSDAAESNDGALAAAWVASPMGSPVISPAKPQVHNSSNNRSSSKGGKAAGGGGGDAGCDSIDAAVFGVPDNMKASAAKGKGNSRGQGIGKEEALAALHEAVAGEATPALSNHDAGDSSTAAGNSNRGAATLPLPSAASPSGSIGRGDRSGGGGAADAQRAELANIQAEIQAFSDAYKVEHKSRPHGKAKLPIAKQLKRQKQLKEALGIATPSKSSKSPAGTTPQRKGSDGTPSSRTTRPSPLSRGESTGASSSRATSADLDELLLVPPNPKAKLNFEVVEDSSTDAVDAAAAAAEGAAPAPPETVVGMVDAPSGVKDLNLDKLLLNDPLQLVRKLLHQLQLKHGRPANIHEMTKEQLVAEKADVKRVLLHYESRFAGVHGRAPTRAEKAKLRSMYHRNKDLKKAIAGELLPLPAAAGADGGSGGSASSPARLSSTGEMQMPNAGPGTALGLRINFAQLKREKKTLQIQLNQFKADFVAEHGKPPSSGDRQHLKAEFVRYKELKTQMKLIEDNPLFATFNLGQGQTM